MSASREKKTRQDLTQQEGYVDAKAERLAKERREQKKSNALYICIAVVFVIAAIILAIGKSGVLQKNATALTVDGEKFTPAQVDYFYYSAYSDIRSSEYANYIGLDTSKALDKQPVNDMAKSLLGITAEGDLTWDAYLKDTAASSLAEAYRLYQSAVSNGYTVDETVQAEIQTNMDSLADYASQSGYSSKEYLKMVYGSHMDEATFRDILGMLLVAANYQNDYLEGLTYTDAELEAAYQADTAHTYDFADLEYIYFAGTPATTDAEGNTIEPSDAVTEAAAQAAKDAAEDAAARYAAGESLEDIAADYADIASYVHAPEASNAGTNVTDWAFDAARVAGDTAVLENSSNQYFVLFHGCSRPEYYRANVRHILFHAHTDELDPTAADYDASVESVWNETRTEAQNALDQWKSGAATADSFADLANELSEDTGSNTTGGLYSDIYKGSNYVDSFKNWCFEDGRKVGDTGIVESTYGCHVMYLDSFADTLFWQEMVDQKLRSEDYETWYQSIIADVSVEQGSGMKYVG